MKMATPRFLTRGLSSIRRTRGLRKSVFDGLFSGVQDCGQNSARSHGGWAPDERTVAFIINKRMDTNLYVSHVSTQGFTLAGGTQFTGAMILFPHSLLSWHVQCADDVTEESLALFKVLEPKIELLVFGYGKKQDYTVETRQKFTQICKNLGVRFEALPTEQACGVFNFLASDHQYFAAALIPPSEVDVLRLDRRNIFYLEDGNEEEEVDEDPDVPLIDKTTKKLLK